MSDTDNLDMGLVLRTAREAAGLSLATMAQRTYYSKGYLCKVERGARRVTPELIAAYERALGDDHDLNRRQLLLGLMAGSVTPTASAQAVAIAFEQALSSPRLSTDDWLAKIEGYGHDYMSAGAGELQARLASDLVRIQGRLDDPILGTVAARLLVVHGKTMPSAHDRGGAIFWYRLGAAAADRSEDTDVRVWTRGRAALALAYEGAALPVARRFAEEALAVSDTPSLGRLNALLALAHVQGLEGDPRALRSLDEARRVFDVAGSSEQISDFAMPEWRMATITSMLLSRLGDEHRAIEAQDTADRTRPASLPRFATHIELHRGLMLAKSGEKGSGIDYARNALAKLPPERHSLSLRLMLAEIEAA
jgi:hypothetical protein